MDENNAIEEGDFDVEHSSEQSDREDYRQIKKEIKNKQPKKKKNIGKTLNSLLKKKSSIQE